MLCGGRLEDITFRTLSNQFLEILLKPLFTGHKQTYTEGILSFFALWRSLGENIPSLLSNHHFVKYNKTTFTIANMRIKT